MRGYFEIGIFNGKFADNVGTLWRTAYQLGANGIFTIGERHKTYSDTYKAERHIPLRSFDSFEEFYRLIPDGCALIGIEMGGQSVQTFSHPNRAIYLLGAEDSGLPDDILSACSTVLSLDAVRTGSYNVAVAGAIVMYDRIFQ